MIPTAIPNVIPSGIPAPESRMGSQTVSRSRESRNSTPVDNSGLLLSLGVSIKACIHRQGSRGTTPSRMHATLRAEIGGGF